LRHGAHEPDVVASLLLLDEPPTDTEPELVLPELEEELVSELLVESVDVESVDVESVDVESVDVESVDVESSVVDVVEPPDEPESSLRAAAVAPCARTLNPRTPAVATPATPDISRRERRIPRSRPAPAEGLGWGWGVVGSFVMGDDYGRPFLGPGMRNLCTCCDCGSGGGLSTTWSLTGDSQAARGRSTGLGQTMGP
jgi:hypothetical protein